MVSSNKLTVLPNGINVEYFRPETAVRTRVRQELGLEEEFLWLAAGRLEPVKDYPTLLWAMVEVPEPARLVIAGAGPLESDLRSLTRKLGLEHRVRFLGFEPDVLSWMQAADGFVLSSRWEGLPMGLLEASACALPAVATGVPGTSEIIVPGKTGSLTTAGSAMSLGGAMTRMMRLPPEERKIMGGQARQRVVEHFSLATVLDRWEALYTRLLERNPQPRRYSVAD
jgi:glycosyltransferase involved in cell wall biosynthesis